MKKEIKVVAVTVPDGYVKPDMPNGKIWYDALMSGKYKQGEGHLIDDDYCYCCLGVRAEILGEIINHKHGSSNFYLTDEGGSAIDGVECGTGVFPDDVKVQVYGEKLRPRTFTALTTLNDSGVPFPLIACVLKQVYNLL